MFGSVFAVALAFALFTRHAWEDYYITYRVSKNLMAGHGLVYTVGERVHVFTSPLNVLIPAVLGMVTGNRSDELVLWLFRILSCGLLAGAGTMLFQIARRNGFHILSIAVLVGLFGLDAKTVDFSINGQETAFMMIFMALMLQALTVRSRWTVLKLGLAWAGLMWTRPDAFIYFGAGALGFLVFNAGKAIGLSRAGLIKVFLGAGAITTVVYAPWVLWAWHYFGSPIPHTIIAKGYVFQVLVPHSGSRLINFLIFPLRMLLGDTAAGGTFLPTYAWDSPGWHWSAFVYSRFLFSICGLYWCVPSARAAARAASFAFMLCLWYLTDVAAYPAPWYYPNAAILAIFVFGHVVQHAVELAAAARERGGSLGRALTVTVRAVAGVVLAGALVLTLCSAYQLRVQQREIEEGNRKQVGLWLRENAASPADTVLLEPLGYIGFYSQLKMLDCPGLCAPEVVAAEKKLHTADMATLIQELRPDWLVLRWEEVGAIQDAHPQLLTQVYSTAKVFDVSQRIALYKWLPGRGYLESDQTFVVLRRNTQAGKTQPAG